MGLELNRLIARWAIPPLEGEVRGSSAALTAAS